jgi:hypothetical protein
MALEAGLVLGGRSVAEMANNFAVAGKAARGCGMGNEMRLNGSVADVALDERVTVFARLPVGEFFAVTVAALLGCRNLRMPGGGMTRHRRVAREGRLQCKKE